MTDAWQTDDLSMYIPAIFNTVADLIGLVRGGEDRDKFAKRVQVVQESHQSAKISFW